MNLISRSTRICFAEWYRLKRPEELAPPISRFLANSTPEIVDMLIGKRVAESIATFHYGKAAVAALPDVIFRGDAWYADEDIPRANHAFMLAAAGRHVSVVRSFWPTAMCAVEILHLPVIDDEQGCSTYVYSSIARLTPDEAPCPFRSVVCESEALDLTSPVAFPAQAAD